MKNNDVELIQYVLEGDENAFAELVKRYQKPVHTLAWRKIGDFHIAEEITQDTFLKVYQRLHTLKDLNQFSGWLYVIATRRCYAWLRKKRIQTRPLEVVETMPPKDSYSQHVVEDRTKTGIEAHREVVKKLLTKLKESERTVMTLHYLGEMTCEEISKFLGVSAGTIKSRLQRARNRLQKEETMIREALEHFQISPNLTENIMRDVARLKPAAPSGSKPMTPWVIGAASTVLIVLMLGIGNQYLAHFQKPYTLDTQFERIVEIVDAPVVQNVDAKLDIQNQLGKLSDTDGRNNGNGEKANQVLGNEGDYTRWNLPEKATARLAKGSINGMSLSPDGTQIAVASATGVWIYDARTGAELALLTDHITRTGKVVFSPDGRTLATGLNSKILLWNTAAGKLLKTFKIIEEGGIKALKFSDDGKTLRCDYYDGSVRLLDITTGAKKVFHPVPPRGLRGVPRYIMGHEVSATALYLNNVDNKGIFAVGEIDGKIRLDDAMTGRHLKTLQDHKERISQLVFSPDGTLLVSADYNNAPLRLWDVTTGKLLKLLTRGPSIFGGILNFSKDGKTLACEVRTGKIELWDVTTNTLRTTLSGKIDGIIKELALSPDSKTVSGVNRNGEIQVWDVNTGEELFSFSKELAFSPDSKTVAGVNRNGEIQVWDVNTGEELFSFGTKHTQKKVTALAFSLDSSTLASAQRSKISVQGSKIRVWDTFNVTQLSDRIYHRIYHGTGLDALVLSPNGKTVTGIEGFRFVVKRSSSNSEAVIESVLGRLNVWETHTGNKLSELPVESHKGDVPELPGQKFDGRTHSITQGIAAFSKNGVMLASVLNSRHATFDNRFTIDLWAAPYEKSHTTLKGHTKDINTLTFTPNGKIIASGSRDGTIRLWDTGTGTQMLSIPSSKANALAFSMDGKILASSDLVNIQLWDVGTGTQLKSLKGHSDSTTVLAFSTDSNILASGSSDGPIRLWDISTGNELTTFKGHVAQVNILSFSPDGKMLASGSTDGAIFLWDISD